MEGVQITEVSSVISLHDTEEEQTKNVTGQCDYTYDPENLDCPILYTSNISYV